jgi:uncharacterized protein YbdZ (MbtH family)
MNHEQQYSIWPAHMEIPAGWRSHELQGSKQECLAHIETLWTDMRPLSVRRYMTEQASAEEEKLAELEDSEPRLTTVERLCTADAAEQRVRISCRPANVESFRDALARGFVHVKFLATGTELGMRLLPDAGSGNSTDFARAEGKIALRGELSLDFVPLRFSGSIELATLEGTGRLERADCGTVA